MLSGTPPVHMQDIGTGPQESGDHKSGENTKDPSLVSVDLLSDGDPVGRAWMHSILFCAHLKSALNVSFSKVDDDMYTGVVPMGQRLDLGKLWDVAMPEGKILRRITLSTPNQVKYKLADTSAASRTKPRRFRVPGRNRAKVDARWKDIFPLLARHPSIADLLSILHSLRGPQTPTKLTTSFTDLADGTVEVGVRGYTNLHSENLVSLLGRRVSWDGEVLYVQFNADM